MGGRGSSKERPKIDLPRPDKQSMLELIEINPQISRPIQASPIQAASLWVLLAFSSPLRRPAEKSVGRAR